MSKHELATKLLNFYRNFDPYEFKDNTDADATEEELIDDIEQQLSDAVRRNNLVDYLVNIQTEMIISDDDNNELFKTITELVNEIITLSGTQPTITKIETKKEIEDNTI